MKQQLSEEQQKALEAFIKDKKAVLVEASAGSGKTRILTECVRRLITEEKDKFFSVLCLTFTNKAADEMKERLKDIPKFKERTFIGTFHEFCLERILKVRRHEIGLEQLPHIFDDNDRRKILVQVFLENSAFEEDYQHLESKKQEQKLTDYLKLISEAKRELVRQPEKEKPNWNYKEHLLYKEFNERLQSQNAMDYDDILLYGHRILTSREANASLYRRQYRYILVDEAQDLNYAQYQIISAICGETHKNVMLVGDSKQAIYGFNGASSDFMKVNFKNDFNPEIIKVENNYRSSNAVLALANSVRKNGGIGQNYFEGQKEILPFENEEKEAKWIIEKIKHWLNKGVYEEEGKELKEEIKLENMAVLARNRFIFKELITQLENDEQLKNQFYLKKGLDKFVPTSTLIKVFNLGLRVFVNPSDVLHFNQILNELGLSNLETNQKINLLLSLNQKNTTKINQKQLDFLVNECWQPLNKDYKLLGKILEKLQSTIQDTTFFESEKEREMIASEIQEILSYWKDFIRSMSYDNQTLQNFLFFLAMNGSNKTQKGLTLATVHTVKGLEYEIVFLMGMNEGVFPDYRAKTEFQKEEERNNAYVAITRAKRCIYITYPLNRKMPWGTDKKQEKSSFLNDI